MNQVTLAQSPSRLAQSNGAKRDRESFVPGYMGFVSPTEDRFQRSRKTQSIARKQPINLMGFLVALMIIALLSAVALLLAGQPLLALAPAAVLLFASVGSAFPQVAEALAMPLIERR
jgi:Na+/proline symporter